MIKKRIIGIFLFITIFLSGCGRAFMADYLFSSDDEDFSKILTDFLSAADENDKEAIKTMSNARKSKFIKRNGKKINGKIHRYTRKRKRRRLVRQMRRLRQRLETSSRRIVE